MIAIIDYDTGNLRSVENAVKALGAEYCVTYDESTLRSADRVIMPGVGEASSAMDKLRERSLDKIIPSLTCPVLGICIGMQLMCRSSEEGDTECLGIFGTDVRRFSPTDSSPDEKVKIPHMGWNTLQQISSPLLEGINSDSFVYYVHSFAPEVCQDTIAETVYGTRRFSAALRNRNFFGTQFHPEKSGETGRKILLNFLNI